MYNFKVNGREVERYERIGILNMRRSAILLNVLCDSENKTDQMNIAYK